ncbi:HxlR family transcriptional regulator [Planobispora rosea]|uniref:HxlR family transcriptional regulator n=1 Tax=Planobispora rosea TaxID=35762 RepID=A0A8J3S8I6_PLARO|nr:helix-turn-helix domain-containing protein [Planobispora rosea]GGT03813.1 HxlR family transcriptional regulator [Planobispora rosea]GIH88769.1 HxlR family transcriptional regulator [Planobispora rosea]
MARTYGHYCGLAYAMDLIAERWAPLVLRELLFGPARYTDLQAALPGIGPNVLSARLKQLERTEVIARRVLPPPAASTVYELTEAGRALQPVLLHLTAWGVRRMRPSPEVSIFRARWAALALWAIAAEATPGPDADGDLYQVQVENTTFHLAVTAGCVRGTPGPALRPADLRVHTDAMTAYELATGGLSPAQATARGLLHLHGPETTITHWSTLYPGR